MADTKGGEKNDRLKLKDKGIFQREAKLKRHSNRE